TCTRSTGSCPRAIRTTTRCAKRSRARASISRKRLKRNKRDGGARRVTILEIKGLRKSYGATAVLAGIDLSVEKGEVVGGIGLFRSGKTTLLRCVKRPVEPTGGGVYISAALLPPARGG